MSDTDPRKIIASLRPTDPVSHSDDTGLMAVPDEGVKLSIVRSLSAADQMRSNHQQLKDAGWDGISCIGPISFREALRRLEAGEPLACGRPIPEDRLEAIPFAYRDAPHQGEVEAQDRRR